MDWEERAILQRLRQEQRQREAAAKFGNQERLRQYLQAARDERRVIRHLRRLLAVSVHQTTHNAPFDAWVSSVRVEIKCARWSAVSRRYQAAIRNCEADILLFDAINGRDHFFVVPMAAVGRRRTFEIYSYNVNHYKGQWAGYLEAWPLLRQTIAAAPRPVQLSYVTDISGLDALLHKT